jgi:hypothetical protein
MCSPFFQAQNLPLTKMCFSNSTSLLRWLGRTNSLHGEFPPQLISPAATSTFGVLDFKPRDISRGFFNQRIADGHREIAFFTGAFFFDAELGWGGGAGFSSPILTSYTKLETMLPNFPPAQKTLARAARTPKERTRSFNGEFPPQPVSPVATRAYLKTAVNMQNWANSAGVSPQTEF